jgi:hypothetical protein
MGGISIEACLHKRAAGENVGMRRLFQLYAECEHSVWNSYVRPDTSNGEFGSPTLRSRNYETVFYYRQKRPELSAAMTVVATLAAGAIATA